MDEHDINSNEHAPYEQENASSKQPMSRRNKLIIGIVAAVIICILGLAIPFILDTGDAAELSVTVFSGGWAEVLLKPGVETQLNDYLASGSDVPGYPLRINCEGADEIMATVDGGTLFTWGAPDYIADDKGMTYSMPPDGTVYWSPTAGSSQPVPQCTLSVSARPDGVASPVRLIIRQTGESGYSITLLSSE